MWTVVERNFLLIKNICSQILLQVTNASSAMILNKHISSSWRHLEQTSLWKTVESVIPSSQINFRVEKTNRAGRRDKIEAFNRHTDKRKWLIDSWHQNLGPGCLKGTSSDVTSTFEKNLSILWLKFLIIGDLIWALLFLLDIHLIRCGPLGISGESVRAIYLLTWTLHATFVIVLQKRLKRELCSWKKIQETRESACMLSSDVTRTFLLSS